MINLYKYIFIFEEADCSIGGYLNVMSPLSDGPLLFFIRGHTGRDRRLTAVNRITHRIKIFCLTRLMRELVKKLVLRYENPVPSPTDYLNENVRDSLSSKELKTKQRSLILVPERWGNIKYVCNQLKINTSLSM